MKTISSLKQFGKLSIFMKAILILSVLVGFGTNAKANTSIDDQINNTKNSVEVGTPTYKGLKFLAYTGFEEAKGIPGEDRERAASICHAMGLGFPISYASNYIANNKYEAVGTTTMYKFIRRVLVAIPIDNGYFLDGVLVGKSTYIADLVCSKK